METGKKKHQEDLLQWIVPTIIIVTAAVILARGDDEFHDIWAQTAFAGTLKYCMVHALWKIIDLHKWGPWGCSEPDQHAIFALKTSWIVYLFFIGNSLLGKCFGMSRAGGYLNSVRTLWDLKSYGISPLENNSMGQDVVCAIVVMYCIDFLRYWAHRIGHLAFFYKTFPFSHAHHHNQVFVNPMTTAMSPMLHLASVTTYAPAVLLGVLGSNRAAAICWLITSVPNITQHLGFDPLPWLTRWNHFYFYGALPWIPLYHCYHHNPFIRTGNFGNVTALCDYLFGTIQPECVYHIEENQMMDKVAERFADKEKLGKLLEGMSNGGKGKNRLDLNEKYDSSVFKFHYL